ncbi:hypothetical protein CR513_36171, partial [Mucuna pruriens]
MLAELVEEQAKTIEAEIEAKASTQGLKELAAHAKERIQEAREEATFWKNKYLHLINMRWDTRKAKLSTYATRSKSKAMDNKIEALEQQNQELKGEMSLLREQMDQLF